MLLTYLRTDTASSRVPAYPQADMGFEWVCPWWSSCSERPLLIPILFRLSSSCSYVLRGLLLLFALISFLMMTGLQTLSLAPFSISPTICDNEQYYRTVKRPFYSISIHYLTFTDWEWFVHSPQAFTATGTSRMRLDHCWASRVPWCRGYSSGI